MSRSIRRSTTRSSGVPAISVIEPAAHEQALYRQLGVNRGGVLAVIAAAYPRSIARERIADRSGYAFGSRRFSRHLAELRSRGLIEFTADGRVVATTDVFTE